MPQTKKVSKPKAPNAPYFVSKYKNWETKSLPRSWKTVTTTAANNPDWLEDREDMWSEQKRDYQKELLIYQHKLAEYQQAKFQELRNSVVEQAAHVAKLKSAEYQVEKARKAAESKVRATTKAVAAAEREALKAIKESSKPPTARDLRMATRTTKSPKNRKTRKHSK
jgi:hypothetical protein